MSKANTKATINANIKQNGNQEITGQILNSVLNQMVDDYGTQEAMSAVQTAIPTLATKTELTELVNQVRKIGMNVNYRDAIRLTFPSFNVLSMRTSIVNVLDTDGTLLACILPSTMTNSGWLYEYEEGWRLCKVQGFTLTNTSTWEDLLDWMDLEGNSTKIAGETAINEIKEALTKQGEKINELETAIDDIKVKAEDTLRDVDLDVSDDNGNVLVELSGGHIKTKNFDSSGAATKAELDELERKIPTPEQIAHPIDVEDTENSDLKITDEQDNVIMRLARGHIKTKNFDSENILGAISYKII